MKIFGESRSSIGSAMVAVIALLFSFSTAQAFQPRKAAFSIRSSPLASPSRTSMIQDARSSPRQSSTQLFVFERMSEDCVAALVTAQKQADRLQLAEVGCEVMMAGCIDHPETGALSRTLKQYSITWRRVQTTLTDMYKERAAEDQESGWLSGFRAAKTDDDRPFGPDLKKTLVAAGKLADKMGSTTVNTQHVFLALLEYNETKDGATAATVDEDKEVCHCGGWAVLVKMEAFDDSLTALDICKSLLKNMEEAAEDDSRELVTGQGESSKTPTLAEVGTDLTQQAADGLLDPVYGRDDEIRSCLRTLIRRRKNNVCLIGEAGVGKTAIAEGVAQILADKDKCPTRLRDHRLISVELASLVAGTKYRGEFEERLQAIVKEVIDPKSPPTILFLDEIHNLVGAGSAEGGMDAANLLKPALARGEMQVIGATTIAEYRKYIEKDAALERRLQPVMVKEPSVEQTKSILEAVQSNYERHHGVTYTPLALEAAAALSDRYISDRFLPDKALDLLDEAGAIINLEKALDDDVPVVSEHTIASVISEWSGIPIGKLEMGEMQRLRALEEDMTRRVKGQVRAVRGVARAVRRARSGLRDPRRPVASFLFCGPTGVGKTELCKTLAETYYGSEKDMIRIDMTEYMEKHSVSRLTGPPPGYIGFEEGGSLTEAVRRAPHSVVLFDEVEKAHGDVLNILLQIMEDGILTDGKGRTINFKNTVLVMTSNVGSKRILEVSRGGAPTVEAIEPRNGSSREQSSIDPVRPDEALKRMQENPKASKLLMEASTNPEIMAAMGTAMNGSPADLLRAGRENPTVARFLEELWGILDDDDAATFKKANASPEKANGSPKSGLDAIRSSVQDSVSQWADSGKTAFASGLMDQIGAISDGESPPAVEQRDHALYPELARVVKEELESAMKPELLNRIDEIVVFSPLSLTDLSSIAELLVEKTVDRAQSEQKMQLTVEPAVIQRVTEEGSANADQFGARPMRRAAQRFVEDSLSDAIIQGFLQEGDAATIDLFPGHRAGGKDRVIITRARDQESLEVQVEDADGGIGSGPAMSSQVTNGSSTNGLDVSASMSN